MCATQQHAWPLLECFEVLTSGRCQYSTQHTLWTHQKPNQRPAAEHVAVFFTQQVRTPRNNTADALTWYTYYKQHKRKSRRVDPCTHRLLLHAGLDEVTGFVSGQRLHVGHTFSWQAILSSMIEMTSPSDISRSMPVIFPAKSGSMFSTRGYNSSPARQPQDQPT